MYISKYYTCPEIDQRLLQGYYDDAVHYGFQGTMDDFWEFILSIKECIKLSKDSVATQNNFSNELKAKLDGIEKGARNITKMSQLNNDTNYLTEFSDPINDLKVDISQLTESINAILQKFLAIDGKLKNLEDSIKELSKKVDSNENKINAIQDIPESEVISELTKLD